MHSPIVPVKTDKGLDELRHRRLGLSQRHRTLLLLVDGRRALADILTLAHQAGVPVSHFEELVRQDLVLVPQVDATPTPPVPAAEAEVAATHPIAATVPGIRARSTPQLLAEQPPVEVAGAEQPAVAERAPSSEVSMSNRLNGPDVAAVLPDESASPSAPEGGGAGLRRVSATAERIAADPAPLLVREPVVTEPGPERGAADVRSSVRSAEWPHNPSPLVEPDRVDDARRSPTPPIATTVDIELPTGWHDSLTDGTPSGWPVSHEQFSDSRAAALLSEASDATPPAGAWDALQEIRELLMRTLRLDSPLFSARMMLSIRRASSANELISVVWALERHFRRANTPIPELASLQRARDMLGMGNTRFTGDTQPGAQDDPMAP